MNKHIAEMNQPEANGIVGWIDRPRIGVPSVIVAANVNSVVRRVSAASNRLTSKLYDGSTKSYAILTLGHVLSGDSSMGAFPSRSRSDKGPDVEKKIEPQTPYERFVAATKRILSVSKEELEKREAAWRKSRAKRRNGSS
jgi:hypothetical protein